MLDNFMTFANEEVLKLIAENERKGTVVRCIDDAAVFGWAMHYFEESALEGTLYNLDGTEYKPVIPKVTKASAAVPYTPPTPKPKPQMSIFDMLNTDTTAEKTAVSAFEKSDNDDEWTAEEVQEVLTETAENKPATEGNTDLPQVISAEQPRVLSQVQKSPPEFYVQYTELTERYPGSIILMRLGDFYEAFDENAVLLAEELNLTLTSRNVGLENRIPIIGIPYHAANMYFSKIREKHSLVLFENGKIVISAVKANNSVIDVQTGEVFGEDIEELSESEMREFDGDIEETKQCLDEQNDESELPYSLSSFQKDTMIYLYNLLDGKMDIA